MPTLKIDWYLYLKINISFHIIESVSKRKKTKKNHTFTFIVAIKLLKKKIEGGGKEETPQIRVCC